MQAAVVSPELVLVDPELAECERRSLPPPSDCLARREPAAPLPAVGPIALAVEPATGHRKSDRRKAHRRGQSARWATAAVIAAVVAGGGLRLDTVEPQSTASAVSGAVMSVRIPATRVSWRAVPAAQAYDVVLWRNGRRVADRWPTKASIELHRGPRLPPGLYRWYVFPDLGARARPRYGPLVTQGTLVIR
jgi:hypothetical protein